jgi:hypothetical protein
MRRAGSEYFHWIGLALAESALMQRRSLRAKSGTEVRTPRAMTSRSIFSFGRSANAFASLPHGVSDLQGTVAARESTFIVQGCSIRSIASL